MKINSINNIRLNNQIKLNNRQKTENKFTSNQILNTKIDSQYYKQYAISFKGKDSEDDFSEEELRKAIADFLANILTEEEKEEFETERKKTEAVESFYHSVKLNSDDYNKMVASAFVANIKMSADIQLAAAKDLDDIPIFYELQRKEILEHAQNTYSKEVFNLILETPELKDALDLLELGTNFRYTQLFEASYSKNPVNALNIITGRALDSAYKEEKYVQGEIIDIYTLGDSKFYIRNGNNNKISKIVASTVTQNGLEETYMSIDFNSDGTIKNIQNFLENGNIYLDVEISGNYIKTTDYGGKEPKTTYLQRLEENKYIKL